PSGLPRALHSFPTRRSSDLPLNALDGYEVLERAPHNREPGAVENIAQAEAAVRPEGEEKGEEDEQAGAQVAEELSERHRPAGGPDRKSTRLNSSHQIISYAV